MTPPQTSTGEGRADAALALTVDARDVSLTFHTGDGEVQALANVDLQISDGDFVSFIGPSGCGKTTLLRVIADLQRPTAGTILINGLSPEEARLRRQYGYIFQAPALYPSATSCCRWKS
jgi:NitT/TauT family transport system ATP-binding protein